MAIHYLDFFLPIISLFCVFLVLMSDESSYINLDFKFLDLLTMIKLTNIHLLLIYLLIHSCTHSQCRYICLAPLQLRDNILFTVLILILKVITLWISEKLTILKEGLEYRLRNFCNDIYCKYFCLWSKINMVWGEDYWLEEQDSSEGECILWKFSYLVVLNPESKEIEGMERIRYEKVTI